MADVKMTLIQDFALILTMQENVEVSGDYMYMYQLTLTNLSLPQSNSKSETANQSIITTHDEALFSLPLRFKQELQENW